MGSLVLCAVMATTACTPGPSRPETSAPSTSSGGIEQPSSRTPGAGSSAAPTGPVAGYPFGEQSFWRSTLDDAPVAADSKRMIDYLVGSISDRYNGVAAFNAHQFNSHLYVADQATPRVDLAFDDCQGKGQTPAGLVGPGGQFVDVPIPQDAVAANGTDAELSVYSPATDQLWEFWKAVKKADGTWSACWGGRLDHVSTSAGHFAGAFGATATGLPNAGGLVRFAEIQRGSIDHAISIAIPNPADAGDFSWPAQRSDGVDPDPAALPEGTRLRLDPALDLDGLGLTPAGLTIARAAQRYGFVVVDRAGAVAVLAEAVPAASGEDPWRQLLGGPDYSVLTNFPWGNVQAIQRDFGKPKS